MKNPEAKDFPRSKLVEELKYRCGIEKDGHVAISADEGDGKTTLAAKFVVEEFGGNLWDNIVYSKNPQEFYDKYNALEGSNEKKVDVLLFDEALDVLDRLKWYEAKTKDLVAKFRGDVRKEKHMVFLYNVQLFRDLHPFWRNHRIRYWIELAPREWFADGKNTAYILKRQRVPFITGKRDAWLLDNTESEWLKKMSHGAIKGKEYLDMLRSHPFYQGEFRFGAATDELYMKYHENRIRAKKQYENENLKEEKEGVRIAKNNACLGRAIELLRDGYGLTETVIADKLGTSQTRISELLIAAKRAENKI